MSLAAKTSPAMGAARTLRGAIGLQIASVAAKSTPQIATTVGFPPKRGVCGPLMRGGYTTPGGMECFRRLCGDVLQAVSAFPKAGFPFGVFWPRRQMTGQGPICGLTVFIRHRKAFPDTKIRELLWDM